MTTPRDSANVIRCDHTTPPLTLTNQVKFSWGWILSIGYKINVQRSCHWPSVLNPVCRMPPRPGASLFFSPFRARPTSSSYFQLLLELVLIPVCLLWLLSNLICCPACWQVIFPSSFHWLSVSLEVVRVLPCLLIIHACFGSRSLKFLLVSFKSYLCGCQPQAPSAKRWWLGRVDDWKDIRHAKLGGPRRLLVLYFTWNETWKKQDWKKKMREAVCAGGEPSHISTGGYPWLGQSPGRG